MTSSAPPIRSAVDLGLSVGDKWKVASHLQKAVRQGRPDDAVQAVHWLRELDPAYLRYRMAVMAIEDVAAGSPELVAQSLSGGWTKMDLARRGPDFLPQAARAWAQARKDRTPCDWMGCTFYRSAFEAQHGPWELMALGKARRLAFDADRPWWERGLAAWRAVGTTVFRTDHLPALPGDWEAYAYAAREAGLSEAGRVCLETAFRVQAEAHPIFFPLAMLAQQAEAAERTPVDKVPLDLGYVGPWLSSALDKHTSEGKRALTQLLRIKSAEVEHLVQAGATRQAVEAAVGKLWFWMEGGQLDKSWMYPTARQIDLDNKRNALEALRVAPQPLFQAFGRDPATWHQARLAALPRARPPAAPRP